MRFMDGHAIDHAHTPDEELHFYDKNKKTLSTNSLANHIPEPFRSKWGLDIRNHLVQDIAKAGGSYGQLAYYADAPDRTDHCMGGSAEIPRGVLFFKHDQDGNILNGWDIPWGDDPIHSGDPRIRETGGPLTSVRSHQLPEIQEHLQTLAYTYPGVHETMAPFDELLEEELSQVLSPLMRYRLEILADSELEAHYSSMLYLNGLLTVGTNQGKSYERTCYWGRRALEHIRGLEKYDAKHFIGNSGFAEKILKCLSVTPFFDRDGSAHDALHQMVGNQKDVGSLINREDLGSRFLSKFKIGDREDVQKLPARAIPDPIPYPINLPTGINSLTQTIRPSESEFSCRRKLEINVPHNNKTLEKVVLFLTENKDLLRTHQDTISIEIIPEYLNTQEKVKKCLKQIFSKAEEAKRVADAKAAEEESDEKEADAKRHAAVCIFAVILPVS